MCLKQEVGLVKDKYTAPCSKRIISYNELKDHASYSDAWLSVNGTVYDITDFIDLHPFGDVFRGQLGTECSGLFSSAHTSTNVEKLMESETFLEKNKIKIVGRLDISPTSDYMHYQSKGVFLDRVIYIDTDKDKFWQDLKSRVAAYLKEHGETTHLTFLEGLWQIFYYVAIHAILSYLSWFRGSMLAMFALSFHNICMLTNPAHMATHFGFTSNSTLNYIAYHLFDLIGMSGMEWQICHQTHHQQPHSAIDHQTHVYPQIGVRIHEYMERRFYHRFQHLYFWLTVTIYGFVKIAVLTPWLLMHRRMLLRHPLDFIMHVVFRGILLAQVWCCFEINGFWKALTLVMINLMFQSQLGFLLLFNDHAENHDLFGKDDDIGSHHGKHSWAEAQVRTAGNWYPTNFFLRFVEVHYGYFNYHIEHHLFPTFKMSLIKKISPIVRKTCEDHNVPYISTTFYEVSQSLHQHLLNLGAANDDDSGTGRIDEEDSPAKQSHDGVDTKQNEATSPCENKKEQ